MATWYTYYNQSENWFIRGEERYVYFKDKTKQTIALPASPSQQNSLSIQPATFHASPQRRFIFTQEAYWSQSITLRSILNAVLIDEWIKELAALCEEHALRLSADNYEDDTYIRSVALWLTANAAGGFRKNNKTPVRASERSFDTSL